MTKNNPKLFNLSKIICSFFGVGKAPFISGTFGSAAAFVPWFLISFVFFKLGFSPLISYILWVIILTSLFYIGVYFCDIYSNKTGKKDAKEIVIDEVVGQLITVVLSYFLFIKFFSSFEALILYFLLSFFLFRFFDILKPGIIGFADREIKGGFGVMMDDVLAGFFAGLLINLIILIKLL